MLERGVPPPYFTFVVSMQMDRHPTNAMAAPSSLGNLRIFRHGKKLLETPVSGRVLMGRQRSGDPIPYKAIVEDDGLRVIVARRDNPLVSRTHLLIEQDEFGSWIVTNSTRNCSIAIDPGHELLPGKKRNFEGTLRFDIEGATVVIEAGRCDAQLISLGTPSHRFDSQSDSLATSPGGHTASRNASSLVETLGSSFDANQRDLLLDWLRLTAQLFCHVEHPDRFIAQAVDSIHKMIGGTTVVALGSGADSGYITRCDPRPSTQRLALPTGWTLLASAGADCESQPIGLKHLLGQMSKTQHSVLWNNSVQTDVAEDSSAVIQQMIATPVLDSTGKGMTTFVAIRGDCPGSLRCPVWGDIEASLMELVASGVKV